MSATVAVSTSESPPNRFSRNVRRNIVNAWWFEPFILLVIVVNCVFLALEAPNQPQSVKEAVRISEIIFTIIYIIEIILKFIAWGLYGEHIDRSHEEEEAATDSTLTFMINTVFRKHEEEQKNLRYVGYFNDGWNILDFVIVVFGSILPLILSAVSISAASASSLRALRVLRPLRTIPRVPKLRTLVLTLVNSLTGVLSAGILIFFLMVIFGIMGLQLFKGALNQQCVLRTLSGTSPLQYKEADQLYPAFCMDTAMCRRMQNYSALYSPTNQLFNNTFSVPPERIACEVNSPRIANGGLESWNNIFLALLQVFQVVTLEDWSRWQYDLSRVKGWGVAAFFIPLTFVINFFALNLVLAVIVEIFSHSLDLVQRDEDNAAMVDEMDGYMRRRNDGEMGIQQVITARSRERRIRMLKTNLRKIEQVEVEARMADVETVVQKGNLNRRFKMRFDPRSLGGGAAPAADDNATEESSHYEGGVQIELQALQDEADAERKAEEGGDFPEKKKRGPMVFTKRVKELRQTKHDYAEEKLKTFNRETAFDIWQLAKPIRNEWLDGKPRWVWYCYRISMSDIFESIIIAVILLNTILLAIIWPSRPASVTQALDRANYFFTFVYLAELLIKLVGLGPRLWVYDRFNLFDAVIVVISIVELVIQLANGNTDSSQGALLAFRALRVLRVLRLLHQIESLRVLLSAILDSLEPIFYLVVVLVLFVFMFGVLGVSLFAGQLEKIKTDNFLKFTRPWKFNNLWMSMVASFEAFSGDAWAAMMGDASEATGTTWASLFFIVAVICGLVLFMNLFLAILINRMFNQDEHQVMIDDLIIRARRLQKQYGRDEESAGMSELEKETKKMRDSRIQGKAMRHEQRQQKHVERQEIKGRSLKIFPHDSAIRIACHNLISNDYFENFINLCIVVNCVFLATNNPNISEEYKNALRIVDIVFTSLFAVEMAIKIIALGLWSHDYAYLKSPWNVLDGLVVVMAILGLILPQVAFLRGFRAVRPIRIALRVDTVRVVVKALSRSKAQLLNAILFCFFILFVLAIVGVHLFSGQFGRCVEPGLPFDIVLTASGGAVNIDMCRTLNKQWLNPTFNFDNVGNALLTMFKISTITNWYEDLANGMATTGKINGGVVPFNTPLSALYFMVCVLIGGFFVLNVIITVVVDSFNRIKTEEDRSALMSREQAIWVRKNRFVSQFPLREGFKKQEAEWTHAFFDFIHNPWFEPTVVAMIVLNTLFMTTEFYGQPDSWTTGLLVIEIIFVVFYGFEAFFKLMGLGVAQYFNDYWNTFDFVVVVVSVIGLILSANDANGAGLSAVRLLRVLRVFRLLKRAPILRALFLTLVYAIPSLVNIGALLLVIFFIWGIIGIELFGKVIPNDGYGNYVEFDSNEGLSESVNFQTFGGALLILYRTATNDNWNSVFLAAAAEGGLCPIGKVPQQIGLRNDARILDANGKLSVKPSSRRFDYECGSVGWAVVYFVSFGIFGTLIMINLFIAVILDTYRDNVEIETKIQRLGPLNDFRQEWEKKDPKRSGKLSAEKFIEVLKKNPLLVGLMLEALGLRLNKDEYEAQLLDEDVEHDPDTTWQHNEFIGPASEHDAKVDVTDDHINAIMESRRLRILCKLKNRGLLNEFWRVKYDECLFAIASLIVGPEFPFFAIEEKFTPIYDWWMAGFEDDEEDEPDIGDVDPGSSGFISEEDARLGRAPTNFAGDLLAGVDGDDETAF